MIYTKDGIEVDGVFYPLQDIINECNNAKITELDLVILEFYWTRRRSSDIYESRVFPLHIANQIMEEMIDKEIYFGEIEGKHSEVYGTLDDDEVKITDDKEAVKAFLSINPDGISYNHSFIYAFYENASDEFVKLASWELQ